MQFPKTENNTDINAKLFIKLKDKESVTGVFRGEPYDYRQHWINNRSQVCAGDSCELCASDKKNKSTFRFRLNFVMKDTNEPCGYVVKIFEQGWGVYEYLSNLSKSGIALEKMVTKIIRNGSDKNNTTYTVIPLSPIPPTTEKIIANLTLHDLANLENQASSNNNAQQSQSSDGFSDASPVGPMPPFMSDNDLPF